MENFFTVQVPSFFGIGIVALSLLSLLGGGISGIPITEKNSSTDAVYATTALIFAFGAISLMSGVWKVLGWSFLFYAFVPILMWVIGFVSSRNPCH